MIIKQSPASIDCLIDQLIMENFHCHQTNAHQMYPGKKQLFMILTPNSSFSPLSFIHSNQGQRGVYDNYFEIIIYRCNG